MKKSPYLLNELSVAAIILGCLAGDAVAAPKSEALLLDVSNAKISVAQAIMSAEKETGGKAYSAILSESGSKYLVGLIKSDATIERRQIDAQTGEVTVFKTYFERIDQSTDGDLTDNVSADESASADDDSILPAWLCRHDQTPSK